MATARLAAQQATVKWRERTGRARKEMARLVGVHPNTYRTWETGAGQRDGPTHEAAIRLDGVLKQLLGNSYPAGDVLNAWGWPLQAELSFEALQRTLREARFVFDHFEWPSPTAVLWVHRLRDPNLVHGVFTLAAAACTRAGLDVRLLLDDTQVARNRRDQQRTRLKASVERWFEFARGDSSRLSTALYSEIVTEQVAAERAWWAVNDYLNAGGNAILDFLVASKAINPALYEENREAGLAALVRQDPPLVTKFLLTPLWNWVVFELEIRRLLRTGTTDDIGGAIVTLGGIDEQILWDMWRNGCDDEISNRVQHIFLRTMPVPRHELPWEQQPLGLAGTRRDLLNYLRTRTVDGDRDLLVWFRTAAVVLPAALNEDFKQMLSPQLTNVAEFDRAVRHDQPSLLAEIADAVHAWFLG